MLGKIYVSSQLLTETGKWVLSPEKTVRVCSFKIDVKDSKFYHSKGQMGKMDLLSVDFRKLVHSDMLEYIDPHALNKAF